MRVRLLLTGLLLTLAHVGHSVEEPSPGLSILVIPTIQYAHQDIWNRTPNGRAPASSAVGRVVRGQAVHVLVYITRYAVGADGMAEARYDVAFTTPAGKTDVTKPGLTLIPRSTVKDVHHVRKAAEFAVFVATAADPLGIWRVAVTATDVVSGSTAKREVTFAVVDDAVLAEPLPPGTNIERWFATYHHQPAPHQVLAAIRFTAENPPAGAKPRRDADNGPWLGFFEQVLTDNPWLEPHATARLAQAEGRERELLATLLAYAKRDDPAFEARLTGAARAAVRAHREERWPIPTAEPLRGQQLDVLWGRFFASGRYEPIRALVGVLAYHPFKDALTTYKKSDRKPAKPPEEVLKSAVFGAATWSLRSNIQQDKVVRDYCEGILLRKELPETEHAWLTGAYRAALENLKKAEGPKPTAAPGE